MHGVASASLISSALSAYNRFNASLLAEVSAHYIRTKFLVRHLPHLKMRLNPSKCEFLCISNKRSPICHSYYLNNHLLQSVLSAN